MAKEMKEFADTVRQYTDEMARCFGVPGFAEFHREEWEK